MDAQVSDALSRQLPYSAIRTASAEGGSKKASSLLHLNIRAEWLILFSHPHRPVPPEPHQSSTPRSPCLLPTLLTAPCLAAVLLRYQVVSTFALRPLHRAHKAPSFLPSHWSLDLSLPPPHPSPPLPPPNILSTCRERAYQLFESPHISPSPSPPPTPRLPACLPACLCFPCVRLSSFLGALLFLPVGPFPSLTAFPPAQQEQVPVRRKSRKSVAFTAEQIVVDADGSVTMVNATEESKETAQSHTSRTQPLSAALGDFADSSQVAAHDAPPAEDAGLDLSLMKKKKKPKKKTEDAEGAADDDDAAQAEDGGLDLSMKKKKKKKAKEVGEADDDFTAKLKQLEVQDADETPEVEQEAEGDMDAGTGIWQHDETRALGYTLLLQRFFSQLSQKNPDHSLSGTKSYKIPPPQCMREGNRKTVFANIADICKRMKRTEEHLTAYLFAELGTNGSVDGSRRLVIKGRFQQKQIENMVRKYIIEYVTCKTCKSPDTELSKGENRLYFITCNNCGSRRSVTAIKTGFSAQVGKRKKMKV
ncbi:hypothetical protein DCS_01507 [Drechmeria coniospora]|uniref:Translation initiation factor IF2/IF5 domain-containing protein n=1 Tax=Drechmeria coniospora TaxID=98403 RepID=A0A151GTH0_DRECN|nr:hypothetical protein DCS_01507 [Drechmeria coniospora]KYK60370.1 hypothetical protein DCS_01507 [Drechmeria coniospora]